MFVKSFSIIIKKTSGLHSAKLKVAIYITTYDKGNSIVFILSELHEKIIYH